MDANLQSQALVLALGAEIARRLAHANCGGDAAVRDFDGRHHGIANSLHDGTPFGGDDLLKQSEMFVDEIEGDEVADTFIKLSRVFEITERERKAQDLEALGDGERVGPVDIAEGRVGEEALRGEYGLASLQKIVQRLVCHPYGRQYSTVGTVQQS